MSSFLFQCYPVSLFLNFSLLLFSYSMILVEIATRSDLISVSMTALSLDYNLWLPFDLCYVTSSPL